MSTPLRRTMRDAVLERLAGEMDRNPGIILLTADLGAPVLDTLRTTHPQRVINVGIAEQNLVTLAAGLALEGFSVFAYAIAPFLGRAWEAIRDTLSLMAPHRPMGVTLLGVGVGISYDISGPTHHSLEDGLVLRAIPGLEVITPSDWSMATAALEELLAAPRPAYLRLDGKPHPPLPRPAPWSWEEGFQLLRPGEGVALVATGHLTRVALEVAAQRPEPVAVVELFRTTGVDRGALAAALRPFRHLVTLEEAHLDRGGLDSLVHSLVGSGALSARVHPRGFANRHLYTVGDRAHLHAGHHLDPASLHEVLDALASPPHPPTAPGARPHAP